MSGNSVINIGDLSKPATVLIERVSDAIGGIAKPWQTKRVASAEAEAEKIRALAQIEISEMEQRALARMIREEGIKQANIEAITSQAIPELNENAKPEEIESDWLSHFFEKSRIVSDSEMQSIWSRILAAEANRPNTFSKRTIDLVASLSKQDAALFTKFCTTVWRFAEFTSVYWYDPKKLDNLTSDDFYMNFVELTHLRDIGLIQFSTIEEFIFEINRENDKFGGRYYGMVVIINFDNKQARKILHRGNVSLTMAGSELVPICGSEPSVKYFEETLEKWIEKGHRVSIPISEKSAWEKLYSKN